MHNVQSFFTKCTCKVITCNFIFYSNCFVQCRFYITYFRVLLQVTVSISLQFVAKERHRVKTKCSKQDLTRAPLRGAFPLDNNCIVGDALFRNIQSCKCKRPNWTNPPLLQKSLFQKIRSCWLELFTFTLVSQICLKWCYFHDI